MMSLQVDRIKQNKIGWNSDYVNPNSQAYRVLEDESVYAVSCMNFTQSPRTLELPANLKQNFQKKNIEKSLKIIVFGKSDIQKKKPPAGKLATEVRAGDAPKPPFSTKTYEKSKKYGNQTPSTIEISPYS